MCYLLNYCYLNCFIV